MYVYVAGGTVFDFPQNVDFIFPIRYFRIVIAFFGMIHHPRHHTPILNVGLGAGRIFIKNIIMIFYSCIDKTWK